MTKLVLEDEIYIEPQNSFIELNEIADEWHSCDGIIGEYGSFWLSANGQLSYEGAPFNVTVSIDIQKGNITYKLSIIYGLLTGVDVINSNTNDV